MKFIINILLLPVMIIIAIIKTIIGIPLNILAILQRKKQADLAIKEMEKNDDLEDDS